MGGEQFMSLLDIPYYRRRAIEENELAAASTEPRAAKAVGN
jgi:hypothetical protein